VASVSLADLCHARSGDKGQHSNIGVITWDRGGYELLSRVLTPARVKEHFGELVRGEVRRYDLPTIGAFNFILEDSLDGGGTQTLRLDALGKALCEGLLRMEIDVPEGMFWETRRRPSLKASAVPIIHRHPSVG
jgi:hypothetical protein